jgi:hypothetical protein
MVDDNVHYKDKWIPRIEHKEPFHSRDDFNLKENRCGLFEETEFLYMES